MLRRRVPKPTAPGWAPTQDLANWGEGLVMEHHPPAMPYPRLQVGRATAVQHEVFQLLANQTPN